MVLFNYATKELTAKVVYYGPGLCGKTTNLQWIHEHLPIKSKGKMLSLATETDRTLFFDFLPIDLGQVRGMRMRIQLYTVPGQVFYNATRRMVLKGADAIVFVVDSQEALLDASLESFDNMRQNLEANEIDPDEIPTIFQYNKRDLPNALPIEILNERLNPRGLPYAEAVAIKGPGVEETLKLVTRVVFGTLSQRYGDGAVSPLSTPVPPAVRSTSMSPGPGGTHPPAGPGPGRTNPPALPELAAPRSAPRAPAPPLAVAVSAAQDAATDPRVVARPSEGSVTAPERPARAVSTIPPNVAQPVRRPSASAEDELFESLDLTPAEEHLPDLEIEDEDTFPALKPKIGPLPPTPPGSRETLAVAPQKAAELRKRIVAARSVEDELGIDLNLETEAPASPVEELSLDVALEDFGTLLGSAGHPILTPDVTDPGGFAHRAPTSAPRELPIQGRTLPEPRAEIAAPWQPIAVHSASPEEPSPEGRPLTSAIDELGAAPKRLPTPNTPNDRSSVMELSADAQIVSAQAQVSVPVEVQVPPGVNRINLSLHLVIKLREKR